MTGESTSPFDRPDEPQGYVLTSSLGYNWDVSTGKWVKASANWGIDVSSGNVSGVTYVSKFGRNADIDAGTEDIWNVGGTWVAPTAARKHSIQGGAADVNTSGTGAWTVQVQGLNGSFAVTTETVNMAGAGGVNTANSYVIIFRMIVLTAGTGGTNAAAITAVAATDTTITCGIIAAKGQSQMAIYQIPVGYTGYCSNFSASMNGGANANVSVELYVKPFGGVFNLKGTVNIGEAGGTFARRDFATPLVMAAKSVIKLRGISDAANSAVAGNFDLIVIAD